MLLLLDFCVDVFLLGLVVCAWLCDLIGLGWVSWLVFEG